MIRFHDLLVEIQSFLENQRKDVLLAKTKNDFFEPPLAYLSDIFELLNELNRKMQGSDNNAITNTDTVKTLIANSSCDMDVCRKKMRFHKYSEVIVTVNEKIICCRMKSYISKHLENLVDEFRRYFPDVVNEDTFKFEIPLEVRYN